MYKNNGFFVWQLGQMILLSRELMVNNDFPLFVSAMCRRRFGYRFVKIFALNVSQISAPFHY